MRKTIKTPIPQLSQIGTFNVDLDMTGKHYAELAQSEGRLPEEVALSIVKDLLEEDANKLTLTELRYLFTLIKINSLENNYTATVVCTIPRKDGRPCNHENHFKCMLSDADLNATPKNYKVPEIQFVINDSERKCMVLPPTMDMEIALYDWFLTVRNITAEKIKNDNKAMLDYTFIRAVMHLVDKQGNRVVDNFSDFEPVLSYLNMNKFQTIIALNKLVYEVNSFGVQNKKYSMKCEECGGTLEFQLPLLYGLSV